MKFLKYFESYPSGHPGNSFKHKPYTTIIHPKNRYLYHQSDISLRNLILKDGLIPTLGDMTWAGWGVRPGKSLDTIKKYTSRYGEEVIDWFPKPMIYTKDTTNIDKLFYSQDNKKDIWIIDTKGLENKWYIDPVLGQDNICTDSPIPLENLQLIENGFEDDF